ncbi:uncharacterized protein LOC121861281 [Homarus americanus]|uniref:uncharacterized protein LOC121861281 n=1 Tax=Homarus americanus TaxID=6706 RepID=UPI001C45A20F|nr:uncharacterized protein LOC121861281 [Homarus americanus]
MPPKAASATAASKSRLRHLRLQKPPLPPPPQDSPSFVFDNPQVPPDVTPVEPPDVTPVEPRSLNLEPSAKDPQRPQLRQDVTTRSYQLLARPITLQTRLSSCRHAPHPVGTPLTP